MNSIENKINNITTLTPSQVDRVEMQLRVEENLLKFLNSQIKKVSEKNTLHAKTLELLMQKLENENEMVSYPVLLKILEISSKTDNEISLGLLSLLQANQKAIPQPPLKPEDNDKLQEKLPEVSNADMTIMKDFLNLMKEVKDSEFTKK
jgi:hypothetical protein